MLKLKARAHAHACARFKQLGLAQAVLSDAAKRKKHDAGCEKVTSSKATRPPSHASGLASASGARELPSGACLSLITAFIGIT